MSAVKIISATLLSVLIVTLLASCSFTENVMLSLGFDMRDYSSESVIATYDTNGAIADKIKEKISIMLYDSYLMQEFSTTKDAVKYYTDEILGYMLGLSYSRYTASGALAEEARKQYPHMMITVLIPASEFEYTVYSNFGGGEKITHKSGVRFTYLDKIQAYTCSSSLGAINCTVELLSLEETENTYRVKFVNKYGDEQSPVYFAMLIKRDDGTMYFKELREAK